jgi:hypothetical protein
MEANALNPLTFGTQRKFSVYLWLGTIVLALVSVGLLLRAFEWIAVVNVAQEPTVLAFLLAPLVFFAATLWMGRWALFHSTAHITADEIGLTMKSAVANDFLRWQDVEEIRIQGLSGSEVKLMGKGHRVTAPSGSAATYQDTKHLEAWIEHQVGSKELKYEGVHFWGP